MLFVLNKESQGYVITITWGSFSHRVPLLGLWSQGTDVCDIDVS